MSYFILHILSLSVLSYQYQYCLISIIKAYQPQAFVYKTPSIAHSLLVDKMEIPRVFILIGICTTGIGCTALCQRSFGIMACYGTYVNPVHCPEKKLVINSALSVINLTKCKSSKILTIIFNKECPLTVQASRPILVIPTICSDRVQPSRFRVNVRSDLTE